MTFINEPEVTFKNTPLQDSFGRLRVSNPESMFGAFNEYIISPFNWVTHVEGTGTALHSNVTKLVTLATNGTASGARSVMQSRKYMRYTPGKSLSIAMTFVFGDQPSVNCEKRAGYFDDNDGIYLSYRSTGIFLVKRSSVSGSIVETAVHQDDWDIDKLDGTGKSKIVLNLEYGQIFGMDFQFLGMGRVRLGFDIGGKFIPCHEFNHSNETANQPFIRTANLPVRYEIINTGAAGSAESMSCLCAKVDSEGGLEQKSIPYSVSNGVTGKSTSTTLIPLISIRPGPTFGSGGPVNRGWIVPRQIEIFNTDTSSHYYQIIWNATLTGANWQFFNDYAMGQFDVTATAVSLGSGVIIEEGYIKSGSGANRGGQGLAETFTERPLVNSFDGTTPDLLTIAVRTLSGTDTAYGAIQWYGYW